MEHFINELQEYKNKKLSFDRHEEMSLHLSKCDQCLEEFLLQIDDEDIAQAEKLISGGFTESVMKLVAKEKKYKRVIYSASEKAKNTIIYYVAAASITLIFVGSGLFQNFIQGFTEPTSIQLSTKIINNQRNYDISGKIVNKASLWIENFESQRRYYDETKE